mmetsp:Transcript_16845/g.30026  ORF Transcript_16845/g.30026 Transcript_16845/m.30026 type:complete len:221 (-) Transcript_16845:95-757(-)|eukprot:CAMPEP_0177770394 /NCGR_PEP_ID=MMETSP0491_2-20121128/10900_1 /TAXON_ID=63592 /ORGANISM="Tetraselmis chuii, Strain PLY429" /LENGTH=220 /DNA_ID=CAMNT_0019287603 /DNA_START=138 /DNA_END=800 /DNA_ORIENTATION=+
MMQALSSTSTGRATLLRRGGGRTRRQIAAAPRASVSLPSKFSTVTPVGDRLYIKLGAEEAQSAGGILLPSSAVGRSNEGQVVSVGKDVSLKVGEQVMYSKYAGTEITAADEEYVLLKEDEVIGVMPTSSVADLKPTGDKVLLKLIKPAQESRGGVMLGSNTEQPSIGKVVAVGPGSEEVPVTSKVGDEVLYSRYAGVELEGDNDEDYIVLRDSDILAVLA